MTSRRNQLRFQTDIREFLNQPLRAFVNLSGKTRVRGDAGKTKERIKIFEVTFAHDRTLARKFAQRKAFARVRHRHLRWNRDSESACNTPMSILPRTRFPPQSAT